MFSSRIRIHRFWLGLLVLVSVVSTGHGQHFPQLSSGFSPTSSNNFFNFEVAKRVKERLLLYLGQPETVQEIIGNYRTNDLFEYGMTAPDREEVIKLLYTLPDSILPTKIAYCGLEDGTNFGTWDEYAFYREPGNSGYTIDSVRNPTNPESNVNYKHLVSCFDNRNGTKHDCVFEPGAIYVKYACEEEYQNWDSKPYKPYVENDSDNNPELCTPIYEPCRLGDESVLCKRYTIETVRETDPPRGYIPLTSYCIDPTGDFTEDPGMALDHNGSGMLGDCNYYYSNTIVNGYMPVADEGERLDYAACIGKTDAECDRMFRGSFYSEMLDPRIEPWYQDTKRLLKPNWATPYVFSGNGDTGITLSYPFYSEIVEYSNVYDSNYNYNGGSNNKGNNATETIRTGFRRTTKKRFEGVCAVDYRLIDFTTFLVDTYGNTSTLIVLFEADYPHRVIGSSTGSNPIRNGTHLTIDQFYQPDNDDCSPMDEVLVRAYLLQRAQGYPDGRLITVKTSNDINSDVYASQSTYFKYPGIEGLDWRVIILSQGVRSDQDEILPGSAAFMVLMILATAGVVLCTFFFVILYRKRTERAVIFGDWRFTCAFLLGCILLNASSYAIVGPSTDTTCLLRMWTFHLMIALGLSPLFVKVYRMYVLIEAGEQVHRMAISNRKAASWTLPIVLVQILILVISTFVSPPTAVELIENNDGEELVLTRIVCASEQPTMMVVRFIFEAGLISVGCILAYKTRDLKQGFGECKQLCFCMYNIALVIVIIGVVVYAVDMNESSKGLLRTIGVLWATGFSAAAFVVPRMVQVQRQARSSGRQSFHNRISGTFGTSSNPLSGSMQNATSRSIQGFQMGQRDGSGSGSGGFSFHIASTRGASIKAFGIPEEVLPATDDSGSDPIGSDQNGIDVEQST